MMNIDLLNSIYQKSLHENEYNINFWEKYLRELNALDLTVYSEKLTVPVLVPLGNTLLFRGEVKHTNEVTVALGANYFAKCSVHQAEVIRQHRIKNAQSKLELFKTEREYLKNHVTFSKQNFSEDSGHDIIEVFTEEEDKAWRKQHRERVRQYKQRKDRSDEEPATEVTDEDLWSRLEELELQEEMRNELTKTVDEENVIYNRIIESSSNVAAGEYTDSDDGEDDDEKKDIGDENKHDNVDSDENASEDDRDSDSTDDSNITPKEDLQQRNTKTIERPKVAPQTHRSRDNCNDGQISKSDLLHQVIERHDVVLESLSSFKNREKPPCKNEDDLVARLNEMEKVEELEDEMDRLEDIIHGFKEEDIEKVDEDTGKQNKKKSVSFADKNECVTLELNFEHSLVEPSKEPYDSEKGIMKPSDIYEAYCKQTESYNNEPLSILKKKNYATQNIVTEDKEMKTYGQKKVNTEDKQEDNLNRVVVIKDVVEKVDHNANSLNTNNRPMSVFKKMRQQRKS